MISLKYEAPSSLGDAIALLARASGTSRVLAGGTDVIVQMETDLIEPDLVVDIKKIPQLREIAIENGAFRVGAAVTGMELTDHRGFCRAWPGVVDGVKLIGSMQIKGRATMGGNLCNASPAADSVPALIAAGAVARVAGPDGTRDIPVEGIPIGPGKTSLSKGEIVVSFLFPPRPPYSGDAYLRMTPRTEMDIAVVGVGVNVNQQSFPAELRALATSLLRESGERWEREPILIEFLRALDNEIAWLEAELRGTSATAGLLERFAAASSWVRGKRVSVAEGGGYTGVTDGLDARGFLRVAADDGTLRTVLSGGVRAQ